MRQAVLNFLDREKIEYQLTEHDPVYTMEDMVNLGLDRYGTLCKNLFIRSASGKQHFLVLANSNTRINLKELGVKLGAGKVSFASPERLQKYLGVEAGCVSPFGVLNDAEHEVVVVFEKSLADQEKIGVHPNEHNATLWLSFEDLVAAIEKIGNRVLKMEL